MTPALFSNLAILLFLIGFAPYLVDIHRKKVKPHIMSWVGWGFITILGASAMYAEGSTWIANFIAFQGVVCFLIAFYAVFKKVAVYSTSKIDYVLFSLGILGIIFWQITGVAEIALVFAIFADLCFGIPTIIKVWKEPASETRFPWGMNLLGDITALFAIQTIAFHEMAYPIYLVIYDAIVFLLIIGLIKTKSKDIFLLKNKLGDEMAIYKISDTEGVLFLTNRKEDSGLFIIDGEKKMPIVSFEMPPETCGVDEEHDLSFYTRQFIDSLNTAIKESNVNVLLVNWEKELPERYANKINARFEFVENDIFLDRR